MRQSSPPRTYSVACADECTLAGVGASVGTAGTGVGTSVGTGVGGTGVGGTGVGSGCGGVQPVLLVSILAPGVGFVRLTQPLCGLHADLQPGMPLRFKNVALLQQQSTPVVLLQSPGIQWEHASLTPEEQHVRVAGINTPDGHSSAMLGVGAFVGGVGAVVGEAVYCAGFAKHVEATVVSHC